MAKRLLGIILCVFMFTMALTGCTSVADSTVIPLLLKYSSDGQVSYVKALWSPERGTIKTSSTPILSYSDSLDVIAVHWQGVDKAVIFTRNAVPDTQELQTNGVKINMVSLASSLPYYYEPRVVYTTDEAVFSAAGDYGAKNTLKIFQFTASETKEFDVEGLYVLSTGVVDDTVYALVVESSNQGFVSEPQSNITYWLSLVTIDNTGTVKQQLVVNSEMDAQHQMYLGEAGYVPTSFIHDSFYFEAPCYSAFYRVQVTATTPVLKSMTAIQDDLNKVLSTTCTVNQSYSIEGCRFLVPAKVYGYGNYLAIIVEDSFYHAIAAFNDKQQLAGFIVRDPLEGEKTNFITFDASATKLNTFELTSPVQVIIP